MKDHYKTLGVSAMATTEEIRKATKNLIVQWLPKAAKQRSAGKIRNIFD